MSYNYDKNKGSYYTDRHEYDDVVDYTNNIVLEKYFKVELRCHIWVNVIEVTARLLEEDNNDFPKSCSYNYYVKMHGEEVVYCKYHIDTHPALIQYIFLQWISSIVATWIFIVTNHCHHKW